MIELSSHDRGTVLRVKAQPHARKAGILGEHAGSLKIGVTVAPEKGDANAAILRVLAEALHCRTSGLVLLSGEASREKRSLVLDLEPEAIRRRLEPLIAKPV